MAVRGRPGPSFPRQSLGARPPQRAGIGCGPGEGGGGSGRAQARCCYCSVVPPGGCLAPGAAPCPRAAAMPVSPAAMPRPSGVAAAAGLGGTRCDRPWCRPVPAFLGPSLTGAAAPGGGGGRAGRGFAGPAAACAVGWEMAGGACRPVRLSGAGGAKGCG